MFRFSDFRHGSFLLPLFAHEVIFLAFKRIPAIIIAAGTNRIVSLHIDLAKDMLLIGRSYTKRVGPGMLTQQEIDCILADMNELNRTRIS